MRNAIIAVGIILIGTMIFLGSTVMILGFQGRLEGEELEKLNDNAFLGTFLPDPDTEPEDLSELQPEESDSAPPAQTQGRAPESQEPAQAPARTESGKTEKAQSASGFTDVTDSFSAEEIQEMVENVQESKARCEQEWAAIEMGKLNLERLREDLTERKRELEKTMTEVAMAKSELDAARSRFRSELLTIEDNEDKMIRKLAEVYENMKPVEKAAEQFEEMDLDQAVKIMVRMDSGKAAKIFPYISADRVKDLTEKLSRFQEKSKADKKQ